MEESKLLALHARLVAGAPVGRTGGLGGDGHSRGVVAVVQDLPKNALYAGFVRKGAALTQAVVASAFAGRRETFADGGGRGRGGRTGRGG